MRRKRGSCSPRWRRRGYWNVKKSLALAAVGLVKSTAFAAMHNSRQSSCTTCTVCTLNSLQFTSYSPGQPRPRCTSCTSCALNKPQPGLQTFQVFSGPRNKKTNVTNYIPVTYNQELDRLKICIAGDYCKTHIVSWTARLLAVQRSSRATRSTRGEPARARGITCHRQ